MNPAFTCPAPSYNSGLALDIFLGLEDRTIPIIPRINPTKKQANTIEQIPNTRTAVALGNIGFVSIQFFLRVKNGLKK